MNSLPQGKEFIKNWLQENLETGPILDVGAGCGN